MKYDEKRLEKSSVPQTFEVGHVEACQRCGSTELGVFLVREWNGPDWHAIMCRECRSQSDLYQEIGDAVKDWNRRNAQ